MSGPQLHQGDKVAWNFGSSHAEGRVEEITPGHVDKEIKGKTISRNGTPDNPAVYVTRDDQKNKTPVLKKASELHVMQEDEHVPGNQHVETEAQLRRK